MEKEKGQKDKETERRGRKGIANERGKDGKRREGIGEKKTKKERGGRKMKRRTRRNMHRRK